MSVGLYDNAFVEKLRGWTKDTVVTILTPDETRNMFAIMADKNDDQPISLPIISLKRPGGFTVLRTTKSPLSNSGMRLFANSKVGKKLRAIPVNIPYQLDIYTRYQSEADELIRNIVYNIVNYPRLEITIPYYNENYIHYANIRMQSEVEDTSNIPERLVPGQFTRMTIQIFIDDAYLFDVKYDDTKHICPNPTIESNDLSTSSDGNLLR